jgi:Protein of unknown function (DUF3800)
MDVLLPVGGLVVALTEGYFDESGDFETPPGIFCVSGYVIRSEAAKIMDEKWDEVLRAYDLPYFHMVDCAHGAGVFAKLSKQEQIDVETKMIGLIKQHTLGGFSVVTKKEAFEATKEYPDPYSFSAYISTLALKAWVDALRIEGDLAYFFESGHKNKGSAYRAVADQLGSSASVTFAAKEKVRLLQAADILAWQTTKYVKDSLSKERPPRKDFMSLMEHIHSIQLLDNKDRQLIIRVEEWPESRRSKSSALLVTNSDRSTRAVFENGEILPVIIVDRATGWRLGPQNNALVTFQGIGDKEVVLGFDEMRLSEAIGTLLNATNAFPNRTQAPVINVTDLGIDIRENEVFLPVSTPSGVVLALRFSGEFAKNIKEKFNL